MIYLAVILATILAVVTGILHIRAEYFGPRWHIYLLKPLTTWTILLIALFLAPQLTSTYQWLIVSGLIFSLAGDVFLMLPQDRFLPGLISFLIAHLFYLSAFAVRSGFHLTSWLLALYVVLAGVIIAALWLYIAKLRIPVILYMVAILAMTWQASEWWLATRTIPALCAAIGALLFTFSDSVLALDHFRRPFASARALVLSTYYTAQLLLAWSVLP